MKKRTLKKAFFIEIALLFLTMTVFAKSQDKISNPNMVVIEGKILDSNINSLPNKETEIWIRVSKYPFNLALIQNLMHKTYKLKVKNLQNFKFIIPALADRFYLSIQYIPKIGTNHWQSGFTNIYIIDKGDRIKCILSNDEFKFSGKGSDKLNCQTDIYKTQWKLDDHLMSLYNATDFTTLFNELDRRADSCFVLRKKIIETYRIKLGNELSNIMLANCYGLRYQGALRNERVWAQNNPNRYIVFLNSKGYKEIGKNSDIILPPKILANAPIYTDFLFEKIMMQTRVFINNKIEANNSPDHMERVYNNIKTNYKGTIREKLIATFFVQWQSEPTVLDYIPQSLDIVIDTNYRGILLDIKKKNARGTPFYPFELETANGKQVKLQDLNEKVVILDFWYTGCFACIKLKKEMAGIWEKYKANDKVSFVSISIDKDKEEWKRSILTKRYTEPEAINLYTNGIGKNHPLISKQQITSYPRVYLLKGGKIYSANMPYPSGPDTNEGTNKDIIDLIEAAIASK